MSRTFGEAACLQGWKRCWRTVTPPLTLPAMSWASRQFLSHFPAHAMPAHIARPGEAGPESIPRHRPGAERHA